MDDKLPAQLIAFYKSRGIDLHYLLDDDYFKQLKLPQKIQIIKEHAAELATSTQPMVTPYDIRKLRGAMGSGAISGALAAGSFAARTHGFSKAIIVPSLAAALGGAVLGGTIGGITRAFDEKKNVEKRIALNAAFTRVAENPTNENALHALMLRNLQRTEHGAKPSPILDFIKKQLKDREEIGYKDISNKAFETYNQ